MNRSGAAAHGSIKKGLANGGAESAPGTTLSTLHYP
jgi:hypothetical protein